MNCLWSISVIFTLLALEVRTYYAIPVEMATGKFNYVENNQCQTSIVRNLCLENSNIELFFSAWNFSCNIDIGKYTSCY